jgi:FMN-dependent NADH-azoreductase
VVQKADLGAGFDILVDGKLRTYRDVRQTAIEAGIVFKRERPQSEVTVRDVRDNSVTTIDGEFIAAFEVSRNR